MQSSSLVSGLDPQAGFAPATIRDLESNFRSSRKNPRSSTAEDFASKPAWQFCALAA
jgi:hypothetical protein